MQQQTHGHKFTSFLLPAKVTDVLGVTCYGRTICAHNSVRYFTYMRIEHLKREILLKHSFQTQSYLKDTEASQFLEGRNVNRCYCGNMGEANGLTLPTENQILNTSVHYILVNQNLTSEEAKFVCRV